MQICQRIYYEFLFSFQLLCFRYSLLFSSAASWEWKHTFATEQSWSFIELSTCRTTASTYNIHSPRASMVYEENRPRYIAFPSPTAETTTAGFEILNNNNSPFHTVQEQFAFIRFQKDCSPASQPSGFAFIFRRVNRFLWPKRRRSTFLAKSFARLLLLCVQILKL